MRFRDSEMGPLRPGVALQRDPSWLLLMLLWGPCGSWVCVVKPKILAKILVKLNCR